MTDRELRDRAAQAINGSSYRWRTVKGVSKEIGVSDEAVARVLVESGDFVRAQTPNQCGESLFSTTERYRRETPMLGRLIGAATNTVAG